MISDQELLNLKKSIDSAKRKQSESEGKKKALLETLEEKFGCKSIPQAQKKLTGIQTQVEELEREKQAKVEKLEREYEF